MASKAGKKRFIPESTPAEEGTSSTGTWRPQVESEHEFNPFANSTVAGERSTQIGESVWESAPPPQPAEGTAAGATRRKRRSGRKVAAKKTASRSGSRKRAAGPARGKAKAKVKAKAKARSRGKASVRTRRVQAGRRGAARRKAKRR